MSGPCARSRPGSRPATQLEPTSISSIVTFKVAERIAGTTAPRLRATSCVPFATWATADIRSNTDTDWAMSAGVPIGMLPRGPKGWRHPIAPARQPGAAASFRWIGLDFARKDAGCASFAC